MTLQDGYNFLNFWINKYTGSWYTPAELDLITDRGQMSLYADLEPKYATSEHIKDALAPFREIYTFDYPDTLNGLITVPSNRNLLNLLDCTIYYDISSRSFLKRVPVQMYNEDVLSLRQDSQIDPVSATAPIGEVTALGVMQLTPQVQYRGRVTFLRRPLAPYFAYTIVSGMVIVYDANNSVQLEWPENWQNAVYIKALSSIGINLSNQEVEQYSQLKTQENFLGENRL